MSCTVYIQTRRMEGPIDDQRRKSEDDSSSEGRDDDTDLLKGCIQGDCTGDGAQCLVATKRSMEESTMGTFSGQEIDKLLESGGLLSQGTGSSFRAALVAAGACLTGAKAASFYSDTYVSQEAIRPADWLILVPGSTETEPTADARVQYLADFFEGQAAFDRWVEPGGVVALIKHNGRSTYAVHLEVVPGGEELVDYWSVISAVDTRPFLVPTRQRPQGLVVNRPQRPGKADQVLSLRRSVPDSFSHCNQSAATSDDSRGTPFVEMCALHLGHNRHQFHDSAQSITSPHQPPPPRDDNYTTERNERDVHLRALPNLPT
ncbi:hypothetical protein Micbo1qcDRAFT_224966 [Microdochium bolleyi]|uniref:Uncharacterized protein n=1 Tax=Microdochium bolleyi TaxID=196109 RepID=A0A136IJ79_9PEZI|nr:hypothetical protein Micbo1qcDRAFT_224966 [Microdochium bolleyi]